jgi:hypothetical protein
VAHTCNSSYLRSWGWETPAWGKKKVSETPISTNKSWVWWHTCHPSFRGSTNGVAVWAGLGINARLHLKNKTKRDWGHGSSGRVLVWKPQGPEFLLPKSGAAWVSK